MRRRAAKRENQEIFSQKFRLLDIRFGKSTKKGEKTRKHTDKACIKVSPLGEFKKQITVVTGDELYQLKSISYRKRGGGSGDQCGFQKDGVKW